MQQYSKVRVFLLIVFLLVSCDIGLSVAPPERPDPSGVMVYLVNIPRGLLPGVALALVVFAFRRMNHLEWQSRERQQYLEERERQLRTITSSTHDGIIMMDPDGNVSFWNEAATRIFGYAPDEIIGRSIPELLASPSDRASFWQTLPHFRETGTGPDVDQTLDMTAVRKNGELFPMELSVAAVQIRKQWHAVAVVRDATERKQTEQETRDYAMALESANQALEQFNEMANAATRAKSEFLANMSHEIRTPMTAILGFAEVLRDPQLTNDDRESAVDTILRNGQHLLQLINDILDLSKIESGRMVLEQMACRPIEIARDVVSLMSLPAAAKQLSLILEFDGPMPECIESDPTRLRQILINLVANAIKFTETGGVRLVVRLLEQDGQSWIHWEIIDSGIGMTAAQVGRIFDPFTQADETVTRKYGGTGLGLAISWRMAQAMGGSITVESTPNQGSTFRLATPVEIVEDTPLIEDPARWETTSAQSPRADTTNVQLAGRVLLAEDGRDNQKLIEFVLHKAGAEVEIAENGLVACQKATAAAQAGSPFDVILMDMQMPELDGYAAAARLRREGITQPIIALTAHAMADDRQKCVAAGCDDFATKPIQRADLLALVAHHLTAPCCASAVTE
ncbi:MAG: PAS domain S-box protein [Pirellulales bacterium]|nr:PAS domain S-box protein [Pirellulales bacterium]